MAAVGSVAAIWRYPVKSMMGEELDSADVTERGVLGDRVYALVDKETGRVVSAKNPRKWARMFECSAEFTEPPHAGEATPPVRITLPDGSKVQSDDPCCDDSLSKLFGREVKLTSTPPQIRIYEHFFFDYQPALGFPVASEEGELVTSVPLSPASPPGTVFDYTPLHLLTTGTLYRLKDLYPEGAWDVRRFRPNLVIEPAPGESGFVEDAWIGGGLTAGTVGMRVIDTMARCVMTTLPQGGLPNDPKILKSVADNHRVLMPLLKKEVPAVGVAAVVTASGWVQQGDAVTIV